MYPNRVSKWRTLDKHPTVLSALSIVLQSSNPFRFSQLIIVVRAQLINWAGSPFSFAVIRTLPKLEQHPNGASKWWTRAKYPSILLALPIVLQFSFPFWFSQFIQRRDYLAAVFFPRYQFLLQRLFIKTILVCLLVNVGWSNARPVDVGDRTRSILIRRNPSGRYEEIGFSPRSQTGALRKNPGTQKEPPLFLEGSPTSVVKKPLALFAGGRLMMKAASALTIFLGNDENERKMLFMGIMAKDTVTKSNDPVSSWIGNR